MLSPDEVTQTTDALEQLSRSANRRNTPSERRHSILQQRQTDSLPSLAPETPNAKLAWRQVTLLREENKHLHSQLDVQRAEVQRLISERDMLKSEAEREVAVIHNGQQQEVVQYQNHLQELMNEHNRLQQAYAGLEQHYQELSATFQHGIEEEVHKRIADSAAEISLTPTQTPEMMQDAIKELERQVKEEGDRYLAEAVYLKREANRMINTLEQERQQLATLRQEVYAWQHNVRQQAEVRQKTLHARLHDRWRIASLLTSLGLVGLLVVLQLVCLALLHVSVAVPIAFALVAPIVVCIICAFIFTKPVTMLNHMFKSAPHRKRANKR